MDGPKSWLYCVFIQYCAMPHRAPPTAADLAEIYDREPTETVLALLWEIHRLRSTVLRADQIRRMIGSGGSAYVAGTVWQCFERELDAEPCIRDAPTPRQQQITERMMQRIEATRKNGRRSK